MHSKKIILFPLVSLILLLFFIAPTVTADGGAFIRYPHLTTWSTLPQDRQIGFINYNDGYEKLIIAINVKNSSLDGDRAVWIFPVPAEPDQVSIDLLDQLPVMYGSDIDYLARTAIASPFFLMYLSQTYAIPIGFFYIYAWGMVGSGNGNGYTIYEHITKTGFTTEKVGANDSAAFQAYLTEQGLMLPEEANTIIDDYIDQDYCFIVSWISDVETFKQQATVSNPYYYDHYQQSPGKVFSLGVSINFPTEKMYYPLRLTSVYGNEIVPITLQVMDMVTPVQYPDIAQEGLLTTDYYRNSYYAVPTNLTTFFATQIQADGVKSSDETYRINNMWYTEISLQVKAKYLTDDLWMQPGVPAEVATQQTIASNGLPILIALFIIISCVSSLAAGIIVYHKQRPSYLKFAALGLTNFGGLITVFLVSFFMKIERIFVQAPKEEIKTEKKIPLKWIGIGSLLALLIIIMFPAAMTRYYPMIGMLLLLVLVGPVIGMVALFVYGFYKDKQKTAFILLFSLFFMILTFITHLIILSAFS